MDEAKDGERERLITGGQEMVAAREGDRTQGGKWATGLKRDSEVSASRRERENV